MVLLHGQDTAHKSLVVVCCHTHSSPPYMFETTPVKVGLGPFTRDGETLECAFQVDSYPLQFLLAPVQLLSLFFRWRPHNANSICLVKSHCSFSCHVGVSASILLVCRLAQALGGKMRWHQHFTTCWSFLGESGCMSSRQLQHDVPSSCNQNCTSCKEHHSSRVGH